MMPHYRSLSFSPTRHLEQQRWNDLQRRLVSYIFCTSTPRICCHLKRLTLQLYFSHGREYKLKVTKCFGTCACSKLCEMFGVGHWQTNVGARRFSNRSPKHGRCGHNGSMCRTWRWRWWIGISRFGMEGHVSD